MHIRPIEPSDKALLADGLRRLSDASVRLRFLSSKPSFTAAELRYLTEVDGHDHIALVAIDDATGCLIGVARCVRLAGRPDTAEMAIVVGDAVAGPGHRPRARRGAVRRGPRRRDPPLRGARPGGQRPGPRRRPAHRRARCARAT